ncbi:hypothetical protein KXX51_005881 [Aspergillus fumigatus]|nr:hypothetical protein KXX51_005881 [Aspergillus fumigatus]
MSRIGWYGLGSMGLAMATNLQRHLATKGALNLVYSNRTMARGDTLKRLGAVPEPSFPNLVAQCGIIFTMISNDTVLSNLITTAVESGHSLKDKIFVDCSTVHPQTVGLTVSKLKEKQASFLAAPVFGGNPIAVDGKLVFAIGGPRTVGEAQVFAERTGLGTGPMEELIGEAFGAVAGGYSKRLTSGAYAPSLDSRPGFGVSLAIKDANHALAIANEQNVRLPGLQVARENMMAAREYAGECLDSSSMYGVLRQQAGLEFWNEKSRKGGR